MNNVQEIKQASKEIFLNNNIGLSNHNENKERSEQGGVIPVKNTKEPIFENKNADSYKQNKTSDADNKLKNNQKQDIDEKKLQAYKNSIVSKLINGGKLNKSEARFLKAAFRPKELKILMLIRVQKANGVEISTDTKNILKRIVNKTPLLIKRRMANVANHLQRKNVVSSLKQPLAKNLKNQYISSKLITQNANSVDIKTKQQTSSIDKNLLEKSKYNENEILKLDGKIKLQQNTNGFASFQNKKQIRENQDSAIEVENKLLAPEEDRLRNDVLGNNTIPINFVNKGDSISGKNLQELFALTVKDQQSKGVTDPLLLFIPKEALDRMLSGSGLIVKDGRLCNSDGSESSVNLTNMICSGRSSDEIINTIGGDGLIEPNEIKELVLEYLQEFFPELKKYKIGQDGEYVMTEKAIEEEEEVSKMEKRDIELHQIDSSTDINQIDVDNFDNLLEDVVNCAKHLVVDSNNVDVFYKESADIFHEVLNKKEEFGENGNNIQPLSKQDVVNAM